MRLLLSNENMGDVVVSCSNKVVELSEYPELASSVTVAVYLYPGTIVSELPNIDVNCVIDFVFVGRVWFAFALNIGN